MRLPQPGQTFEQKYEIHQELGEGGFATVFKARDLEVHRDIAIKVLAPRDGSYPSKVVARFMREARVIANLQDAHTIKLYEFGESSEGLLYMVFQYVSGIDLRDIIRRRGPLAPEIVVHVVTQVLSSLAEAHAAGILHRDIKPANILIHEYMDDEYSAKLLDFGIAKVDEQAGSVSLTKTGAMIGTPRYMSPEQVFGEEVGPYSDIYSLGLVAYEMLVGEPVVSGTREQMLRAQISDEPIYLPYDVGWVSLRQVVEKMLARDPRDRFRSAMEARNAFKFALKQPGGLPSGPLPQQSSIGTATSPGHSSGGQLAPSRSSGAFHDRPGTYSSGATPISAEGPAFSSSQQLYASDEWSGEHVERRHPRQIVIGSLALAVVVAGLAVYFTMRANDRPSPVVAQQQLPNELVEVPTDPRSGAPVPEHHEQPPDTGDSVGQVEDAVDAAGQLDDGCGIEHQWQYERWMEVVAERYRRSVQVFLPKNYDPNKRYPVVIALQMRNWDVKQYITRSSLHHVVADQGVVVLGPQPASRFDPWIDPGDLSILQAVVPQAATRFCLDQSRVYAVGSGAGGVFARVLACEMPLSAIATSGDGEPPRMAAPSCTPDPAVPMLWILGRDDPYVRGDGRPGCTNVSHLSIPDHHALWKRRHGCTDQKPKRWLDAEGHECVVWECPDAPYAYCDAAGGHWLKDTSWTTLEPSSCNAEPLALKVGPTAWKFFESHGVRLDVEAPP